jgi:hypothetical protein
VNVGFTGTLKGMSIDQEDQLAYVLDMLPRGEFHHGAAKGADTQAARIAERRGWRLVPHPAGGNPLDRNHDIVAAASLLIAAPLTDKEVLRSGTWATVRYARKAGAPVLMLSRGKS